MFNLDTIKLFYDDCRLLVTFENSLDQDQVPSLVRVYVCLSGCLAAYFSALVCVCLCACVCVCLSVCLSVRVRAFACLHIGA